MMMMMMMIHHGERKAKTNKTLLYSYFIFSFLWSLSTKSERYILFICSKQINLSFVLS